MIPQVRSHDNQFADELARLAGARHHDPFAILGRHAAHGACLIRAFLPDTAHAWIEDTGATLDRVGDSDLFEWRGDGSSLPARYRIGREDAGGQQHIGFDPYAFGPCLSDFDLWLFGAGRHWHIYRHLGANLAVIDGIEGTLFATWAPNAERVSVVGDFNAWDGRRHPMRVRGSSGVWELFLPGIGPGALYKFEIRQRGSDRLMVKSDPYGRRFEYRPATAAVVTGEGHHTWGDQAWLDERSQRDWLHAPMSIYEVHLGSWQRAADGGFLDYRTLADRLVAHVRDLGFTHIELLPVGEHPLDASWGYQSTGFFAPTSRHGSPDDFRYFVDHCHRNGIGVILDWVPGHFPRDEHAIARFDGTPLYEHADPRRGEHLDWGTYIFNYGRHEVRNFLLSSALYWMEEFHIDGLRVDAVASMLYLDYSRPEGQWLPNPHGGRENIEAIDFLRDLNHVVHTQFPGALVIAEESTAWPQVTRPPSAGGLGFSMKWNMGWMHDTLRYMQKDPVHRTWHHNDLTFGMLYAFTENFVLPFSHDEVVHGKRSMLDKMPGDEWQRFANLRLLYTYLFTYPGKKLLFMGSEFAHGREWNHDESIDWGLLERPQHAGIKRLVGDLAHLYRAAAALHRHEFTPDGFEWLDCDNAAASVLAYRRVNGTTELVVVMNFTPVPRHGYRLGVAREGYYREIFNSDSRYYGGSDLGNGEGCRSEHIPSHGRPGSIVLTLPPLAGIVLKAE